MSHYTKLMKIKMCHKSMNSQIASNKAIGHFMDCNGMYASKLFLQH
jgi:hypothetical protein